MTERTTRQSVRVVVIAVVFAAGFFCGSVTQHRADAQLGEMGGEALKKAGEGGGALGSAVQLGTAIVDMQDHVNALQKNLETLKKVKAALGG